MFDFEIVHRIRHRMAFGFTLDEIHTEFVVTNGISEENFFLYYQAAKILDSD